MAEKIKNKIKIKAVSGEVSDKVREERAKLTGSFISGLGIGAIVIGVARPLLDPSLKGSIDLAVVAISVLVGGLLHLLGRWVLRGMREPSPRKEPRDDE